MKKKNLTLRYIGLFLLVSGSLLNIRMILIQAWPTYLFFVVSGIGILQIITSFLFKQIKVSWQIVIAIIPLIILFFLIKA